MIRHAIPYTAPTADCLCPQQACYGIIPALDCPDHGARRNPAMEWHEADGPFCRDSQGARFHCDRGHPMPADFYPAGEPDDWDDTCRCKPTA
ncbi:hypothetical protein ACIBBD_02200 [Streptomyces sp. NPDC051315]|uniref:hypothetical protein n=1 Tax=Streptomyces sp. NPDC051315 TaxID=3365650 RepID=UPI0037A4BB69